MGRAFSRTFTEYGDEKERTQHFVESSACLCVCSECLCVVGAIFQKHRHKGVCSRLSFFIYFFYSVVLELKRCTSE